jgi:signal transduction histidine kinase
MERDPVIVLLIEDDPHDVRSIRKMLSDAGTSRQAPPFQLIAASRLASGLARLVNQAAEVVLLDLTLPDADGVDAISTVRALAPHAPIITLTDFEDEAMAAETMQQGAQDNLVKGSLNSNSLARAIRHAIERQRLLAELARKAEELEARNTELDEFAHTVAHQVQGLLSQMVGYTGYIDMNYAPALDDEARRLLRQILQSGNKMNNVISELLLLASVRKGEVIQFPLNMGRIVAEAMKRLRFQVEEYDGQIEQPESWPVALGYPSWIEELWVNYISNGLKYGGPSPRLVLGAEGGYDGMIRFWVMDQGEGIAPEDQKRLFTPHTRLHQVRARGEGLGLSIVRRIAQKCGGQVGVESELDAGSTFWFTLPAADLAPDDRETTA